MFRPIRGKSPRAKATRKLQGGLLFLLVFPPLQIWSYLIVPILEERSIEPDLGGLTPVLPSAVVIPAITLLIGLMLTYDGWWHLRRLDQ